MIGPIVQSIGKCLIMWALLVVQQGSKWNKCEIHSRDGIIDVAENEHVDLIVMGSREVKREKEYAAWQTKDSWKCGKKGF